MGEGELSNAESLLPPASQSCATAIIRRVLRMVTVGFELPLTQQARRPQRNRPKDTAHAEKCAERDTPHDST